jgi:hypothetical protein
MLLPLRVRMPRVISLAAPGSPNTLRGIPLIQMNLRATKSSTSASGCALPYWEFCNPFNRSNL